MKDISDQPKLLEKKQVLKRYHSSNATLYRWIRDQAFPRPISVSTGKRLWLVDELEAFALRLVAERDRRSRS